MEWVIAGMFHLKREGSLCREPTITVTRLVEEDNMVVAEGTVGSAKKDGGMLNAVFCDLFVLQDAKIKHLTSYLMEVKQ